MSVQGPPIRQIRGGSVEEASSTKRSAVSSGPPEKMIYLLSHEQGLRCGLSLAHSGSQLHVGIGLKLPAYSLSSLASTWLLLHHQPGRCRAFTTTMQRGDLVSILLTIMSCKDSSSYGIQTLLDYTVHRTADTQHIGHIVKSQQVTRVYVCE